MNYAFGDGNGINNDDSDVADCDDTTYVPDQC